MGLMVLYSRAMASVLLCAVSAVVVVVGSPMRDAAGDASLLATMYEPRVETMQSDPSFAGFKQAMAVPASSPVSATAAATDTVVEYEQVGGGDSLEAVILRPTSGEVFRVPPPSGDGDDLQLLNDALEEAADSGAALVLFPRGETYTISTPSPVQIEGFSGATIDFNESIVELHREGVGVRIAESSTVVLRNGQIAGHGQLASIGEVVFDAEGRPTFRIADPYRAALDRTDEADLVTVGAATEINGRWAVESDGFVELFANRSGRNVYAYDDGVFRPEGTVEMEGSFQEGQNVWLLHRNNEGHGVMLDNKDHLSDVTIEDMTLTNIPGMAIAGEVERGLHLRNVDLLRADGQVFAASSDAVHVNANGGDIVIEDCVFEANADDKINIKGNYWAVAAVDRQDRTITVEPVDRSVNARNWGSAGDRVTFIEPDLSLVGNARIVNALSDGSKRHVVQLDEVPASVQSGMLVANPDNSGGRVVIRHNIFDGTRSQGVLVQTQHVVVESNRFANIAGPAIELRMVLREWFEAVNVDNVLIEANVFSKSSLAAYKPNEQIHVEQTNGLGDAVSVIGNVRIVSGATRNGGDFARGPSPSGRLDSTDFLLCDCAPDE